MNWLVKTRAKTLEVWSDSEYESWMMKCEYYGATPFWKKVRKLDRPATDQKPHYSIGEVIPYKKSVIGKHFAVIIKLFTESGQKKFLGIDIETKTKVVASVTA